MFEKQNNEHQNVPELFLHSRSQKTNTNTLSPRIHLLTRQSFRVCSRPEKVRKTFWLPSQKKTNKNKHKRPDVFPFSVGLLLLFVVVNVIVAVCCVFTSKNENPNQVKAVFCCYVSMKKMKRPKRYHDTTQVPPHGE